MMFLPYLLLLGTLESFLSVGGEGSPAPEGVIYAAAPEERGAFHVGGKGVYNYGYNTGDGIAKVEVRHSDGSVTGSYRYFDPLGRQIVRSYIADKKGFRVMGNELPVAPDAPAIGLLDAQTLAGPVEGSRDFSSRSALTSDPVLIIPDSTNLVYSIDQQQEKQLQAHRDAVKQQEYLIKQQEEKLTQLRSQHEDYLQQQQRKQVEQLEDMKRRQDEQYRTGFYSMGNTVSLDTPNYFYARDNIDYDFPAGFAYNVHPVRYVVNPVGVKGEAASLLLTAGHTTTGNYQNPVFGHYREGKSGLRSKNYRHPFIVGHAR